ncbi:MAG TPA: hypothetical protein DDW50_21710 [Firmicutes bacterium]|jgi:hypothetical protein|nr:hypothetical protein [Bacillota bacterium]
MKKLLAIVLSAVMILAFTAAAMATDVSFTGDAEFYRDQVASNGTDNDTKFHSEYELYIAAKLSDKLTVTDGLDICANNDSDRTRTTTDQSLWIKYNFGPAQLSLTNDDFQAVASTAILADPNYFLESESAAVLDATLAEHLSLRVAAAGEEYGFNKTADASTYSYTYDSTDSTDTGYLAALSYAGEHFGVALATTRVGAFDKAGYDVSAFCKVSALKAYVSYGVAPYDSDGTYGKPNADEVVGLNFAPNGPFSATVEYNFQDDPLNYSGDYSKHPLAFLTSYKIGQYSINFKRILNDVQGVYFDGNPVNRSRAWVQVNF